MDEREAVARLQSGDIGGLEVLVRRYQGAALKLAFLVGRDPVLAEDIVQTAFLRAYERIDHFNAERPFGPWFLRGVVNETRNAVTRRRQESWDAEAMAALPSYDLALDDVLVAAETEDALREALDRLTPGQRAAIVAHYYLELSDTATARRLAVPAGTVRRRLHDARGRLRHLLPAWIWQEVGE